MRTQKGFTLIELLVVISIISLLTSIALASLNTARAKARDARRLSDLRQVQNALFLCRDKIGSFNINGETKIATPCNREGINDSDFVSSWTAQCSEFMPKLPVDPLGSPLYQYAIHTSVDDQHFALLAILENSPYAKTTAEVTNYLTTLGITGWSQCPEYNYVIGF
ncbi:MAG: hypothetical protein A2836_03550 [Candidatus Taylorbacteria bacterium RIFCSPHIGHO2_01_FULL_45_63]|uniref:Type II secretion system protein GspG C-terminal domain-containing protein n=1 Tax=Candidatus Taylorbacteria bacterium RIFCSPHIGHO2_02_FULL_45_35 TaxID=1802311 RepID=A0A1G2MQ78_9BACT|nr:MAG: hypothetical protein A2836_03550 [Candidatus Taylorbacteria bacterium RIFCSPHIGHO2_01_FULL_45_63]OHA26040.1 MAG: hypothetical protein A3D56_02890 [Candidatus Taylorbacteria bacterium RIFCSPHIGHO2_02_FULL_45_35]OHA32469.1 MAG: hypothetical protein A3A22_01555 [Candidatus Taylorbacteria bacterium RIFCSPLOWO2_01_FULL_45_34b]